MKLIRILWVDDEIDLLKPYIIFLKNKGFDVFSVSNGNDALTLIHKEPFDIIILDENMPGLSGLQVLDDVKKTNPHLPVIMVTKSEEENIMEGAIGANIADYLIKPVNPNQLLLSIKKITEKNRLVSEKSIHQYQTEFNQLSQQIAFAQTLDDWKQIYKKIVYYDLNLQQANDDSMSEIIQLQRKESNYAFCKFIKNNYLQWFESKNDSKPIMSANLLSKRFFPLLSEFNKVFLVVIDNLRFDHWETISSFLFDKFTIETDLYSAILPTATSYARNALFSGLMPSEIEKIFPEIWLNDDDDGLKNQYEEQLFQKQCSRLGIKEPFFFKKIITNQSGKHFLDEFANFATDARLGVMIYNFIDILSHSQTESKTMRELADSDASYRSIVLSWFEHSPLYEIMLKAADMGYTLVVTTDHGSIRVENPVKVIGERAITANLRYKQGRNMNFAAKEVFEIANPSKAFLPKTNISASYIFSINNDYFVYPNNYNQFVNHFRNTYQHGGVSMEEMLIPYAILKPKHS
jgi:CheY-like chemotaxis protein